MSLLTKMIFGSIAAFYCGSYVVWMSLLGHGLKGWHRNLDASVQQSLNTAAIFQSFHALALFVIVFSLSDYFYCKNAVFLIPLLFSLGILFFSFSLYIRAYFSVGKWFSMVTPLGGVCLLLGWSLLLVRMVVVSYFVAIGSDMASCESATNPEDKNSSQKEKPDCCKT